jgi:hypothetical protein
MSEFYRPIHARRKLREIFVVIAYASMMRFVAFLFLAACSSASAPAAPSTASKMTMTVVPHLIVGLAFPGVETAPHEKISLAQATALKTSLAPHRPANEGDREWFFHGFDKTTLYFFVGRYHVRCDGLGCLDYVAEKIYEVPRGASEHALDVEKEIAMYERGANGVHAGMRADDVIAMKGQPSARSVEQYFGWSWWTYPDMRVLVVSGEVQSIAGP